MNVAVNLLSPTAPAVHTPGPSALPSRLWPALVLVGAYWGFLFFSDWLELTTFVRFIARLAGTALLTLLLLVWWWANRGIRFRDRLYGFAVLVVPGVIAATLCDPS